MPSTSSLYEFLLPRFTAEELHRLAFLHYPDIVARLPSAAVPTAEFIKEFIALMQREDAIDGSFFELLGKERPRSQARSAALAAELLGSDHEQPPIAPPMAPTLRIIFLAANPTELPELALAKEARRIEEKLRMTPLADRLRFTWLWRASPDDLLDMFFEPGPPPAILHFSGHGETDGGLVLEAGGRAHAVAPPALAALLAARPKQDRPRLIVLNTCYSAALAKVLVPHVDAVIGMRSAVDDEAALNFSVQLYRALAHGDPLQTAFDTARAALRVFVLTGEDLPQLSVRSDLDPRAYVF